MGVIPTGLQELDKFLPGGIPGAAVTDVFGASGTGKTQLLLQLAASCVRMGGSVLYVDSSGKFRPERVVEIQKASGSEPGLDRITVARVTNAAEQEAAARNGFSMILVDSATDLFSYEYPSKESAPERNRLFMGHMRSLAGAAVSEGIPVVVTNMVRTVNEEEIENMKAAIDPFTHVKIHLSRAGSEFRGAARWALGGLDFAYEIGAEGLRDPQDI